MLARTRLRLLVLQSGRTGGNPAAKQFDLLRLERIAFRWHSLGEVSGRNFRQQPALLRLSHDHGRTVLAATLG